MWYATMALLCVIGPTQMHTPSCAEFLRLWRTYEDVCTRWCMHNKTWILHEFSQSLLDISSSLFFGHLLMSTSIATLPNSLVYQRYNLNCFL